MLKFKFSLFLYSTRKEKVHSYHLIDLKSGCEDFQSESTDNGFSLRIFIQSMQTICSKPCMTFHPKCLICLDVIKDIKTKIKVSPVEEEIKFRLESLCDPLPDKDKCVNFVERNTVKFLNTLVDDINEKSVCQEIGYC